ncbi:MAG TPA: exopolyphosphatase [Gaiellaceae bacterium]|nr:exopolyphosphatase [Gaiellaceae bacterium]
MIVAGIDLGTNTTRLLVADVEGDELRELHRETRITRLGEGVDARGILLPVPIARVRNVLTDYRRTAESLGAERMLLVATSAVRDADNGEAFLGEIEWSYGFATRLLSGEEEAATVRRGVGATEPGTLIVDIGGGSTELVLDDFHTSLPLGSVRFTERHGEDVPALVAAARELLPELEPRAAVATAGTVTTLAALDLGLAEYDRERVHGHRLTLAAAREQLDRLAALPLAERRELRALEPERAPVIVAGAAILVAVLERYGLDAATVSEHDLLDGTALMAAELPEPAEGEAPPGAYTCC